MLLVGDSIMGNTAALLPQLLPEATFVNERRNGSGLASPIDGLAPADFVAEQLDANPDVDTAVIEWGGACELPCPYVYGSPEFVDAWFAEAQRVIDVVRDRGVTPVWAVSPPPPPGRAGGGYEFDEQTSWLVSWKTRGLIFANGIAWSDWWQALAAVDGFLGHYEEYLWYGFIEPPAIHKVRADDGIHLAWDGIFRTAYWTAATLREVWGTS